MSSKRQVRRRACGDKRRYATEFEARRSSLAGCFPYRCPFGAHFHTGHPPARLRRIVPVFAIARSIATWRIPQGTLRPSPA